MNPADSVAICSHLIQRYFSDIRTVFELAEAVRAKKKIVFLGLRWPAWWNPMRWISIVRLDLDEALTLANFQVSRFFTLPDWNE